jgi:predicted metal-binding protein
MRATDRKELEALFRKSGYDDFKWMEPRSIVVSHWVRMKCMFGCKDYGRKGCCPPNVPSVAECRAFFDEYRTGAIFHFDKKVARPEDRRAWTRKIDRALAGLERRVFLLGYERTFLLMVGTCRFCAECTGVRETCLRPPLARPTPEAMAVDVFSTVRQYGYPIEVLPDYRKAMNRYAFLLVE